VFLALARHGTLSATARTLRVNHATVSRRIAGLEASLGRPLFDRRPDGYGLNAEGQAVLSAAQGMEQAAMAVLDQLGRVEGLSGTVRLATTRVLADGFLAARMGELMRRHPELAVELLTDNRSVSLSRHEADIALRLGRPQSGELRARKLATIGYGLFGVAEDLPLIGFDEDNASLPEAQFLASQFPHRTVALRSNSQTTQAEAAAAGLGIAALPRFLATRHPSLRELPGVQPPPRELWMLTRREAGKTPRVRAVMEFLAELFRKEKALF